MAIVGALPFIILDGQPVVAAPVMADFNFIASQVNANVPALIGAGSGSVVYVPTVGGTSTAITLTPTSPITSYSAGQSWRFIPQGTNSGSVTVDVSGLGTRSLLYADGSPMTGYELVFGQIVDISDNGSNFVLVSAPGSNGIGVATAILSFGGASTGIGYVANEFTWNKTGRVLTYILSLGLSSKGSATGAAVISGLPFPVNASWGVGVNQVGGGLFTSNVTFASGYCSAFLSAGTDELALFNVTSGAPGAFLNNGAFANNSQVYASGSYIV